MSWPLWVFDSLLLRRALADLNMAAVLATVRAACGLPQRDLAGIAGWSPAALSYYERGRRDAVFDIRVLLRFADAVGMPREILLPLVLADPGARLAAAPMVAAVRPRSAVAAVVTGSHIRYWQACADALYRQDQAVGGTALLSPAVRQWQLVQPALTGRGNESETGRSLLAAAGDLALCTGRIAVDGGTMPLARSLYGQARDLAGRSGDTVLAVHVLTSLSMLHAEMSQPGPGRSPARRALRLAFQAAEEGRYLPMPRLHALIALRQASASSLLGDEAAFQGGIRRAARELYRGRDDDDPPQWLRFVGHTEVTGVEARGWLDLGEAARSVVLYRRVLASELSMRDRAGYGAGLAVALLKQGARRDAVAAGLDVLSVLEGGVSSAWCLNRLRLVRLAAPAVAGAEEFCDRFDAVGRRLALAGGMAGGGTHSVRREIPA